MGAMLNPRRAMRPEVANRVLSMNEHYRPCRTRVYARHSLGTTARITLANVYCFSRLFYNAGTWDALRDGEAAHIRSGYMSVLRAIAGMSNAPGNDRTTDEQVLVHLEQISCAKRLAILRLLFLIRLVRYAPAPSSGSRSSQCPLRKVGCTAYASTSSIFALSTLL